MEPNDVVEMLQEMKRQEEHEMHCEAVILLRNDFGFSLQEEMLLLSDYNQHYNGTTIH